jgi:DNA-binding NarL/FixJ family response regulator
MSGLRILIAEDQEVLRRGLRALLEDRPGWVVCGEAVTGAEAVEKARSLVPDVLLLDVTMPDMGAAEVIPQIIGLCPAVKIVALATPDSAELAASSVASGATGLALRSEESAELVLTVERISDGRPFLSAGAVTLMKSQLAKPKRTEPLLAELTPREVEVLASMARGLRNKEIAATLGVSVKTVNTHCVNIRRTLKMKTRSALVHFAIRNGIVQI